MRHHAITKRIPLLLFFALLSAALFAQTESDVPEPQMDAPWQLLVFPAGDATATGTVNEFIESGYIPVGIEIEQGESLTILLVQSGGVEVKSWAIIDYDDWNSLEAEITGGIQDGYVPMDISRFDERLGVLWVEAELPLEGWRISTSENSLEARTQVVNKFQTQGFTLWGISEHEDLMWYLFIRQPGAPPAGAISRFSRDAGAIQQGIVRANESGWVPSAIAGGEASTYIGFIR